MILHLPLFSVFGKEKPFPRIVKNLSALSHGKGHKIMHEVVSKL